MEDNKVIVKSLVNGRVGLTIPERNFHRTFAQLGAKVAIDKDMLREAFYESGVATMFNEGILYIEDKAFRQELGMEPTDDEVAANDFEIKTVVPLDLKLMDRYLTKLPMAEFRTKFSELTATQKQEIAHYAIQHDIIDNEKITLIKKETGTDVLKAIALKRANEEPMGDMKE